MQSRRAGEPPARAAERPTSILMRQRPPRAMRKWPESGPADPAPRRADSRPTSRDTTRARGPACRCPSPGVRVFPAERVRRFAAVAIVPRRRAGVAGVVAHRPGAAGVFPPGLGRQRLDGAGGQAPGGAFAVGEFFCTRPSRRARRHAPPAHFSRLRRSGSVGARDRLIAALRDLGFLGQKPVVEVMRRGGPPAWLRLETAVLCAG